MSVPLPPDAAAAAAARAANEERTWAMACHLAALSSFVIPFGNLVGPLVVWIMKRDKSPLVDANGKAALNFQLSFFLYNIVLMCGGFAAMVGGAVVLMDDRVAPLSGFGFLGFWGILGVAVLMSLVGIVLSIVGGVKAYHGEVFHYPLAIPFIR